MRWTGKFYVDSNYKAIPNYNQHPNMNISELRNDVNVSENNEVEAENNTQSQMTYDPTRNDVTDILLVWGTDENYEALEKFNEAWNNEDPYLREKWREAIWKEFENMEKNDV